MRKQSKSSKSVKYKKANMFYFSFKFTHDKSKNENFFIRTCDERYKKNAQILINFEDINVNIIC